MYKINKDLRSDLEPISQPLLGLWFLGDKIVNAYFRYLFFLIKKRLYKVYLALYSNLIGYWSLTQNKNLNLV